MNTSKEIIKAAYLYDPDLKGISVYNGEITFWDGKLDKPTDEQLVQFIAEYKYDEEVKVYQQQRQAEYPQIGEQLDKIYHGTLASWKAEIKTIKGKYPKATMDATELQARKDKALFDLRKEKYDKAVARLARYELSAGVKNEYNDYVIKPLPIVTTNNFGNEERNPLIVQDEKERETALKVIDMTPQAVIDSINT